MSAMFLGSMQYTIGTALARAHDLGHGVEVLVEGHWVGGTVVACDGVGVVLESSATEHCVVRLERVSAVRVRVQAPARTAAAIPTQAVPVPA